jgi:hypothetical protein
MGSWALWRKSERVSDVSKVIIMPRAPVPTLSDVVYVSCQRCSHDMTVRSAITADGALLCDPCRVATERTGGWRSFKNTTEFVPDGELLDAAGKRLRRR